MGQPHGNAFVCKRTRFASFWPIIHMDPVNTVPANTLFWNLVSGWKNPKTLPLRSHVDNKSAYFVYRSHHHPTCRPLAFDRLTLRRLITTTTTMVDYMLVFVPQKILSLWGLQGKNIMLLCHYAEQIRIMDNWVAIFVFFLLCSVSPSTVCLYTVRNLYAHSPSHLLCFWWISSATYRPAIWTTACWVISNGSVWLQTLLKQCQGRVNEDMA